MRSKARKKRQHKILKTSAEQFCEEWNRIDDSRYPTSKEPTPRSSSGTILLEDSEIKTGIAADGFTRFPYRERMFFEEDPGVEEIREISNSSVVKFVDADLAAQGLPPE